MSVISGDGARTSWRLYGADKQIVNSVNAAVAPLRVTQQNASKTSSVCLCVVWSGRFSVITVESSCLDCVCHHQLLWNSMAAVRNRCLPLYIHTAAPACKQHSSLYVQYFFRMSVFFFGGGCHGQVGGTRFQVGMIGADQRRYLRPDE